MTKKTKTVTINAEDEAVREEMIRYSETHHLFSPGDKIIVGVSGGADHADSTRFVHSECL